MRRLSYHSQNGPDSIALRRASFSTSLQFITLYRKLQSVVLWLWAKNYLSINVSLLFFFFWRTDYFSSFGFTKKIILTENLFAFFQLFKQLAIHCACLQFTTSLIRYFCYNAGPLTFHDDIIAFFGPKTFHDDAIALFSRPNHKNSSCTIVYNRQGRCFSGDKMYW